jgi:hypothetical protein
MNELTADLLTDINQFEAEAEIAEAERLSNQFLESKK